MISVGKYKKKIVEWRSAYVVRFLFANNCTNRVVSFTIGHR